MMRLLLLLDASNLFYSANYSYGYGSRIDFRRLEDLIVDGRDVAVKTIAFLTTYRDDLTSVLRMFEVLGIETRVQKITRRPRGLRDTDTDVSLATEAMLHAPSAEIVAVASGDGDFVPLYRTLKAMGKRVEAACFPSSTHPQVAEVVDRLVVLDDTVLWKRQGGKL